MHMSQMFETKFLRGADVLAPTKTTIGHVSIEEVGKDREKRPVLHFRDGLKSMALNKTNATTLAQNFGDDSDDWSGALWCVAGSMTIAYERRPVGRDGRPPRYVPTLSRLQCQWLGHRQQGQCLGAKPARQFRTG